MSDEEGRRHRRRHRVTDPPVDLGLPDEQGLPKDRPRGVARRILGGAISFGLVAVIFVGVIPRITTAASLGDALALITVPAVVLCLALGLLNLATNLPPIVVTLPGLRYPQAAVTNTASAALSNTVPEGGAVATGLNFAMLRSWGFDLAAITLSYLVTGIWTNLVRYGLVAVALVIMAATGQGGPALVLVALVVAALMAAAIGVFALLLGKPSFARWAGRLTGRVMAPFLALFHRPAVSDMDDRALAFRDESIGLLGRQWHRLTVAMLASQLSACLVLGAAVRSVGIGEGTISWAHIIVAFGTMSLASLLAPTPGGLGVAEVALVTVLGMGVPDSEDNAIVAAVMLFRLATWFLPIPLGVASYLFWRYDHTWRASPAHGAPPAEPEPAQA